MSADNRSTRTNSSAESSITRPDRDTIQISIPQETAEAGPKLALIEALAERIMKTPDITSLVTVAFNGVEGATERMFSALPVSNLNEKVGPFYTTAGLLRWKGVSRQALNKQVHARNLLAIRTTDGVTIYPAFQFSNQGGFLPQLAQVLTTLNPENDDPIGSALWLNTPAELFGNMTAADLLRSGGSDTVLTAARRAAGVWAS